MLHSFLLSMPSTDPTFSTIIGELDRILASHEQIHASGRTAALPLRPSPNPINPAARDTIVPITGTATLRRKNRLHSQTAQSPQRPSERHGTSSFTQPDHERFRTPGRPEQHRVLNGIDSIPSASVYANHNLYSPESPELPTCPPPDTTSLTSTSSGSLVHHGVPNPPPPPPPKPKLNLNSLGNARAALTPVGRSRDEETVTLTPDSSRRLNGYSGSSPVNNTSGISDIAKHAAQAALRRESRIKKVTFNKDPKSQSEKVTISISNMPFSI